MYTITKGEEKHYAPSRRISLDDCFDLLRAGRTVCKAKCHENEKATGSWEKYEKCGDNLQRMARCAILTPNGKEKKCIDGYKPLWKRADKEFSDWVVDFDGGPVFIPPESSRDKPVKLMTFDEWNPVVEMMFSPGLVRCQVFWRARRVREN